MHFTDHEHPKARKPHHCSTCSRRIEVGETYWRGRGFDGGDAWTWKSCEHCRAVTRLYDPQDMDGLYSESGMEMWLDDGPRNVTELRHMAGYRMRWRTKSGALLPIPTATMNEETSNAAA